jgi:hypothetical protein
MLGFYMSFFIAYLTLYFMGYSLKAVLLNDDLGKYDLYVTPWLGLGLIAVCLYPLSWMGYSVRSVIYWLVAVVALVNCAVWLKYRVPVRFEKSEAAVLAVIALVVGGIYGGILAIREVESYSFNAYKDFGSYILFSKAALESSAKHVGALPVGVPHIGQIDYSLNFGLRGCAFVQAFFAALYDLDLARISYALSAFVMFLVIAAFRPFLGVKRRVAAMLPALCVLAFNTFYQGLVISGWSGQLYSYGLIVLSFYVEYYLVERGKFDLRTCILLVFMLTANSLIYIESTAYPLLPAIALLVILPFSGKYKKIPCLLNVAAAGGLYAIANFPLLLKLIEVFFFLDSYSIAWPMPMATLADVAGLKCAFMSRGGVLFSFIIGNSVLLAVILYQLKKEGIKSFLTASCSVYFLLHLVFFLRYFEIGAISTYKVYKSALSLSFILVIVASRFLVDVLDPADKPSDNKKRVLAVASFAVFFLLNVKGSWNNVMTVNHARTNYTSSITSDHFIVKSFAENEYYADSDFIINCYFLLDQSVAVYFAPSGRTDAIGHDHVERSMKGSLKAGDIYITDAPYEATHKTIAEAEKLFENGKYRIYQINENSTLMFDYIGLDIFPRYAAIDGNGEFLRGLRDGTVAFRFMSMRDRVCELAAVFYNPYSDGRALTVKTYVNGELFDEISSSETLVELSFDGLDFKSGVNEIMFRFGGDVSNASLMRFDFK